MRNSGPIPVHGRLLRPRSLARAQNRTAQFVWPIWRRRGSYLIADEVGAGKSYIALSLAFGLWRVRRPRKQCFRILILAGASELNHSWLLKLVGAVSDEDRIGTLAQLAGGNSYVSDYVKPEVKRKTPRVVVYHLRRRFDSSRLREALKYEGKLKARTLDPFRRHSVPTVEILVTSPSWIKRLQRRPRAADRTWVKWLKEADVLVADEIFGARNDGTIYGRLLRPSEQDGPSVLWRRRRPRLIGLSATLLSRDLTDARSVLKLCLDWRTTSRAKGDFCHRIEEALDSFSRELRGGLRARTNTQARQHVREYGRQKAVLERLLPRVIVRTISHRPRIYRFAAGGHRDSSLFGTPRPDLIRRTFPVDGHIDKLLSDLQSQLASAQNAPESLKWFMSAASETADRRSNEKPRLYPTWTAVTESYRASDGLVARMTHPKLASFLLWVESFYKNCESDWLLRGPCSTPHFKLLVYVHHVRTASALNPRSRSGESAGRDLRKRLRKLMLGTCKAIAKRNPSLFRGHSVDRPVGALQQILEERGWNIDHLKRANLTLLLAACVNAHKGRSKEEKLRRFKKTLEGSGVPRRLKSYRQTLRRYRGLREMVLERIGCPAVLDFEKDWKARKGKLDLMPSVALLDPDSLDIPATEKRRMAVSLNKMEGQLKPLLLPFRLDKRKARGQLQAVASKIASLIESHTSWKAQIAEFVRAPNRNLEKIRRQMQNQHRTPWELAIQTGEESKSRDFVADSFRTVGNPFVLVLTNVCTVGVDLHTYCWDVLHYTPAWTPHEAEQKTGRIDRPRLRKEFEKLEIASQKDSKKIAIHHLIWPHTYDERILSRLNLRAQLSERLLGTKHQDSLENSSEISLVRNLPQFKPLALQPR